MAIFSLRIEIIGRRKEQSSKAAAAYRSGSKSVVASAAYRASGRLIHPDGESGEAGGRVYDFTKKKGVVNSFIMTPEGSPEWTKDRQTLWGSVEKKERRKDAQLARDFMGALPTELNDNERESLVRTWAQEQLIARGMIADIAIHRPSEHGDIRNEHAHILATMRRAFDDGFGEKERAWNSVHVLRQWRQSWQDHCNQALDRAGRKERIDHRTLKMQRASALGRQDFREAELLDRKPQIHVGPKGDFADRFVGDQPSKKRRGLYGKTVDYAEYDQGSRRDQNERIIEGNLKKWARSTDKDVAQMAQAELQKREKMQGVKEEHKRLERQQHAELEAVKKKGTEEGAELRRRYKLMAEQYEAQAKAAKEEEFKLKKAAQAKREALRKVRWLESQRGRESSAKGFYGAAWKELKSQQAQELSRARASGDPAAVRAITKAHNQAKRDLYAKQQKDLHPGMVKRGFRSFVDKVTEKSRQRRLDQEEAQIEREHVTKIQHWYERHKELNGMVKHIEDKRLDALFANAKTSHKAEAALQAQHAAAAQRFYDEYDRIDGEVDMGQEREKMKLRRRAVQQEIEQERSSPNRSRKRNDRN